MSYFYVGPGWYREEFPLRSEEIEQDYIDFMLLLRRFDSPFLRKLITHIALKLETGCAEINDAERVMYNFHLILQEACIKQPDPEMMQRMRDWSLYEPLCYNPCYPDSKLIRT